MVDRPEHAWTAQDSRPNTSRSRRGIAQALKTDVIDLFFTPRDPNVPIEDVAGAVKTSSTRQGEALRTLGSRRADHPSRTRRQAGRGASERIFLWFERA